MSCGTCGIQASDTMQGDTGVPAGAPTTEQARCPRCQAFIAEEGAPCRNRRCPSNQAVAVPLSPAAGPPPPRQRLPVGFRVERATRRTAPGGRSGGTRVIFPDGYQTDFADRMPKGMAIRQALARRDLVVEALMGACQTADTALAAIGGAAGGAMRDELAAAIAQRDLTRLRQAVAAAQDLAGRLLGAAAPDAASAGQQLWRAVGDGLAQVLQQAERLLSPPAAIAEPGPPPDLTTMFSDAD